MNSENNAGIAEQQPQASRIEVGRQYNQLSPEEKSQQDLERGTQTTEAVLKVIGGTLNRAEGMVAAGVDKANEIKTRGENLKNRIEASIEDSRRRFENRINTAVEALDNRVTEISDMVEARATELRDRAVNLGVDVSSGVLSKTGELLVVPANVEEYVGKVKAGRAESMDSKEIMDTARRFGFSPEETLKMITEQRAKKAAEGMGGGGEGVDRTATRKMIDSLNQESSDHFSRAESGRNNVNTQIAKGIAFINSFRR